MIFNQKKWIPYRIEDVVDVNEARMSVRTYLEHKDLRCFLSLINNREKIKRAAEFGCGYGRMTQVLTEFAAEVIGLEREQSFIDEASPLIPDVKFIQVDDLSSKVLEGGAFDVIISFTFLQHLINKKAKQVIAEMIRCLKKSGSILICEETDENHVAGDLEDELNSCTIGRTVETYCRYFSPLTLEFQSPRRIEPGYPRKNIGTYMLFRR